MGIPTRCSLILTALSVLIPSNGFAWVSPANTLLGSGSRVVVRAASNTTATAGATSTSARSSSSDKNSIADLLSQADPSVDSVPLPPAYTECPFTGMLGAGPENFYRQASQALFHSSSSSSTTESGIKNSQYFPRIFSFSHKDQANVEVSGGSLVRSVLNQEFTALCSNAVVGISRVVCGTQSLRTARDPTEHRALRELVSAPLSAKAVAAAIPKLESICHYRVEEDILKKMTPSSSSSPQSSNKHKTQHDDDESSDNIITALDVTQAMALDVVWQQLLGLDLQSRDDIDQFHDQTYTWLRGMYSRPGSPELQATLQAREYLVQAMKDKICQLRDAGHSDGSTMGGLVFARLEDDDTIDSDNGDNYSTENSKIDKTTESAAKTTTLTDQQVIENALLLMLAGVETTSSNLANAILLMGLHPHVWDRVVKEQQSVVQEFGRDEGLTKSILDEQCPYLQAVVQETLRILPVTLVSRRVTAETMVVVDGNQKYQIPQGWGVGYNIYLTHQQDPSLDDANPMDLRTGFRPERWLDATTRPSRGNDFIPFGVGPRKCPGGLLAMTEMKIFLAVMARHIEKYELVTDLLAMEEEENQSPPLPLDAQIAWKKLNSVPIPEDGVQIRISQTTRTTG